MEKSVKKIVAFALALTLALSLSVPAFAEISGEDANGELITTSPVEGNAKYVSVDHHEDDLTVTGSVTGKDEEYSVHAWNGIITVNVNVTESGDRAAIDAKRATVTVEGNVSESGDGYAIHADDSTIHVGGSVEEKGGDHAISATEDAKVEIDKDVTESGNGDAIKATGAETTVKVHGKVTEEDEDYAINAQGGATVEIDKDVTESGNGYAIYATGSGTTVTVKGNVTENGAGDAINAGADATVEIDKDVTESGDGNAIYAKGSDTTVTIEGNVTEEGNGNAIYAQEGATVIVYCNVSEKDGGTAINAQSGSKVIVGGNVTEKGDGNNNAVSVSRENTTVIIEGTVTVNGNVGTTNGGALYLGELKEKNQIAGTDNIHYLIGIAPEGSVALSDVTLVSDIVAEGTVDGAIKEGYRYTTTAKTTDLSGKTIVLKPADGKILTVSGFNGANVTYVANEDGTVTFTIGDSFTGGMQNLVLVLTDKTTPDPDPDPDPAPGPDHKPNAVYYTVRVSTAAVDTKVAEDNDAAAEEMPVLGLGDSGDAVVILQTALNAQGFDCGEVDGIFGQNTLNAVKAFQTAKGLTVDGIVGAQTWEALL